MTATPNLALAHVAASQNQKEVTINAAFDTLDEALNTVTAIAVSGTVNVTATQFANSGTIRLTGTPGAGFTVNVPATARRFVLQNLTDSTATLQVTGGAGNDLEVAANAATLVVSDGANVYSAGGGGAGGGGGPSQNWTVRFRGAQAKLSANATGVDLSSPYLVPWQATDFDTDAFWSAGAPTRLTVPAGVTKVRLQGAAQITTSVAGTAESIRILKNGADFRGQGTMSPSSGFGVSNLSCHTAAIEVEAGDYFELRLFLTGQSSETINAGITSLSIEIVETADAVAPPEDVAGFLAGVPGSSALLLRRPVARALDFPAGLTGSQGGAGAAATAQTDFDLRKNGVSFGTMRFAAAATTASFIAASATSFAAGDVISVHAPASADATLADVGFALAGTRAI